ncbi:Endoplasmic reticulum metallopeptidase 1 [Orchesella cincta]|uniref:FXNA-like protease n=1 Tax=Orchesella cincta TaxID=48709 RepID=A0A1D2N543_ORCCI|nr:Endoplasmic reticulum metallopeptidase 1 [Orchesella cincta]
MSSSASNIDETSTNNDAVRQRRKESEVIPSTSNSSAINSPETFDIETGSFSNEKLKKKSKQRKDFGSWLKNDEGEKYRNSGSFSILSVFILLGVGLLIVKYLDAKLPVALQLKDIPDNPNSFIEERARGNLHDLTSVGVRVSGSKATDQVTVDKFLAILNEIKISGLSAANSLDFEIANVVAKLEPSNPSLQTNYSILVNCHFDTKPGSPGATDNMISCVTMLEVIRVLAGENPTSLRNSIVFLFNGAEELGLQGAHGFVKGYNASLGNSENAELGHRWSRNLKTFINLEGAGGGGREILFQTGPGNSWTLKAYAKAAPYPYGLAIAEEAFQIGLIPSDTDFRIFRDFGDLAGLDMAFIKNGWVYHTKWDRLSEIPPGSLQHMGSNALAILKHLSKEVDFSEIEDSDGKMVFFDVLGLFMIYYPRWAGILIDCLISLGTVATIGFFLTKAMGRSLKIVLVLLWLPLSAIFSWAVGIGVAGLVAVFLNACGYAKPFYSYPTLAIVIFGFPAAIAQIIVQSYALKRSPEASWMAQKLALAVILFVGTFITRAVYIISINLLFSVIAWHLIRYMCRGWPRAITLSYLITGEFIPFLMSSYLLVTLSDVFVPILGRSGSETNANLFFGLIVSAIVTILIWNGFVFVFVSFRRRVLWTCLFVMFFVGNTLLVFGFIGKVPYQEKTPMRLNIVNVDRTWYAADGETVNRTEAGYWFWPYDSNTKDFFPTFEKYAPELSAVQNVKVEYNDCDSLYCSQPFMWPMTGAIKTTHWLPLQEGLADSVKDPIQMSYTLTGSPGDAKRSINLEFAVTTQVVIILSPGLNYKLVNWTLMDTVPKSGKPWKGRNTYFIYHGRGMEEQPMKFSCDFEFLGGSDAPNSPLLNIQYSAFHLHGDALMTSEFRDLVDRLPVWSYTMPWTAVMKMYEIA